MLLYGIDYNFFLKECHIYPLIQIISDRKVRFDIASSYLQTKRA